MEELRFEHWSSTSALLLISLHVAALLCLELHVVGLWKPNSQFSLTIFQSTLSFYSILNGISKEETCKSQLLESFWIPTTDIQAVRQLLLLEVQRPNLHVTSASSPVDLPPGTMKKVVKWQSKCLRVKSHNNSFLQLNFCGDYERECSLGNGREQ